MNELPALSIFYFACFTAGGIATLCGVMVVSRFGYRKFLAHVVLKRHVRGNSSSPGVLSGKLGLPTEQ